ncbi:MAG: RNA polymerase factor sigma-32 [Deltaproteobacteria bacterium]|nr:RNA polymerase factor sigma-32 [Deltaproteobacteria bacterium]
MTTRQPTHSLDAYANSIERFSLLSREQEARLARQYVETGDRAIATKLVSSNLRFVLKIARDYMHYDVDLADLVQEGNLGLMRAVEKFDPDRGYRLISYAVWWIRAYMLSYCIRSWSLVKIGTTQAQRKLFFKLRAERDQLGRDGPVETAQLARKLEVSESEVTEMEIRLAGRDYSLDETGPEQRTRLDVLPAPGASPEDTAARREEAQLVRRQLRQASHALDPRERYLVEKRLLTDSPETLQEIGARFHISRERVRQIELNMMQRLRAALTRVRLAA